MTTRVEWKLFFITDFEKEAAYLTEMHRNGWKFVRIRMGMWYVFEECQPEEVVYQLDFRPDKQEEQSVYEQMYRDYGWEFVGNCNHFGIFRKRATDGDTSLYSDMDCKKAMVARIFKRRYLLSLAIYIIVVLLNFRYSPRFALGVSTIYLPLLIFVGYRFRRLFKK